MRCGIALHSRLHTNNDCFVINIHLFAIIEQINLFLAFEKGLYIKPTDIFTSLSSMHVRMCGITAYLYVIKVLVGCYLAIDSMWE